MSYRRLMKNLTVFVLSLILLSSNFVVSYAKTKPGSTSHSNSNNEIKIDKQDNIITATNGDYKLVYNLKTGKGSMSWDKLHTISNFYSDYELENDKSKVYSYDTAKRTTTWSSLPTSSYGRGGKKLTINASFSSGEDMTVNFYLYPSVSYFLTDMQVKNRKSQSIDLLEPIVADNLNIGAGTDKKIFTTPYTNNFDFGVSPVNNFGFAQNGNDRTYGVDTPWSKFDGVSYWVSSVFDNKNYHGFVAGAATVQNWKSSQKLGQATAANGPLTKFSIYNWGGSQTGTVVSSDKFFLGYYQDYRDGLEEWAKVYNKGEPHLKWNGPVPMGFNSWYPYQFDYNTSSAMYPMTDYIAKNLKQYGYNYVNLDAGWEKADGDWTPDPKKWPVRVPGENPMKSFTKYVHSKGLKAGIYINPFSVQSSLLDDKIPNTNYTFKDATLKDANGNPIESYIGTYILDPTHPGTQQYLKDSIQRFVDWGFDYIKVDFLDFGMHEGNHYDNTKNGMQAYRIGMGIIRDTVTAAKRPIYIDESISSLLPAAFADGRRLGCDTSIGIQSYSGIERQAFNATASWFTNGTLYKNNDPDMIIPENFVQGQGKYSQNDARMLTTAVALGGGSWIVGDNLPFIDTDRMSNLENQDLLNVVKQGKAARPVSLSNYYHLGEHSPSVIYSTENNGDRIVGISNWDNQSANITVNFADLGLNPNKYYSLTDLYTGRNLGLFKGKYVKQFQNKDSTIIRISDKEKSTVTNSPINLSLNQNVSVSSTAGAGVGGSNVVDDNMNSMWKAANNQNNQWIEIDYKKKTNVNRVVIKESRDQGGNFGIANYSLQYWDGSKYIDLTKGYTIGDDKQIDFPTVDTTKLRLYISTSYNVPSISEFETYNITKNTGYSIAQDDSNSPYNTYSDIRAGTERMQTFKPTGTSIPKMDISLFESYVNSVPNDNLYIDIVSLDKNDNPDKTLFTVALPPYNIPGSITPYSIYPNLKNLDPNKSYGIILRSLNSIDDSSTNNKYGFAYSDQNPYVNGYEKVSSDGGKTWRTESNGNRDLIFTIYK
jgi:alpha-galactosidase